MDLHAHVTVPPGVTAIPMGWKRTEILLENDSKTQLDIMLTKHYRIGVKRIESFQDIIDDAKHEFRNLPINRLKIEQDSDFFIPISKENYLEIHMLVPEGIPLLKGWVRSNNPKSIVNGQRRFFMNKRIYESKRQIEEHAYLIKRGILDKGIPFFEFKVEQIVFDSNRALDGWWA